jgi:hypothetical protein
MVKHEHSTCNIASAIPVSTTKPSAPSAMPKVSASVPHQNTESMWAKEVADHLHSVAQLESDMFELLVFYIEKLIMEPPMSWRHDCLQGPPALGAVVCTYYTPLGFEGRNAVINGSLQCSSGQHSHNTCQGYLELDASCFQP